MNRRWSMVCLAVILTGLAACGGGGDEEEEDEGFEPEDPSGGGIWEGTYRIDGQTQSGAMFALATEEGDVVLVAVGNRIFFGKATASGNSFSGNAWSYDLAGPDGPAVPGRQSATFAGTIAADDSISGSYSVPGESGAFNLVAQPFLYERGASLERLAGVYSIPPNPEGYTLTVSINSDGAFTLSASSPSGCMVNGTVQIVHSQYNYYRWTGTQTSCSANSDGPVKGFMYLGDISGQQNNYLRILVQTQSETAATWVGVSK